MEITKIQPLISNKKPWRRLVNKDTKPEPMIDATYYDTSFDNDNGLNYQNLGNAELLIESTEGAHLINSDTFVLRPIFDTVDRQIEVVDENGVAQKKTVKEDVIVGFDKVETVRSGLPEMIITQHCSHLGKNGIEIADEGGKDHEAYDNFRAWKDISGVDAGWIDLLYPAGKCGDAAMYIYQHGKNDIEYKIFSFIEGSILFPHKDAKGNDFLVRKYMLGGREMVDIITATEKSTWVRGDITKEESADSVLVSWFSRYVGWFKNYDPYTVKTTTDGWTRVDYSESQLGNDTPQFVYLRLPDTFIGVAMQNIDAYDRCLSYVSDKMRSTAFAKFFVKALKLKDLPPLSSGEEVIAVEGDPESLKASDAKYVTPPDISDIATINLKNIRDAIMESCMSIDLQPEILKSGADSSQTLKLLLRREIQWCHIMWPKVRPAAKQIINILKELVGKIEGQGERYSKLRISVWNSPWLPQDEAAQIDNATKLVYAGILSKENARHELGLQYTDDVRLVNEEQEDELYRKTFIPKKAEADAQKQFGLVETANDVVVDNIDDDNPDKKNKLPKVDNNASRKDIADR